MDFMADQLADRTLQPNCANGMAGAISLQQHRGGARPRRSLVLGIQQRKAKDGHRRHDLDTEIESSLESNDLPLQKWGDYPAKTLSIGSVCRLNVTLCVF